MTRLKNILQSNFYIFLLILITGFYCYFNVTKELPRLEEKESYKIEGIVKSIKNNGSKIEFEINNVLAIYYKTSETEELSLNVELGDRVSIKGTLKIPNENTNFNLFNYRKYLLSKNIDYLLIVNDIKLIDKNDNLFYLVKNWIRKKVDDNPNSSYLKTFILGSTEQIQETLKNSYQKNGISHLFSVSGMHVSFLVVIILGFLKKISKKEILNNILLFIFLLFYAFITGFSPSILRSVLFMILLFIKNKFSILISSFSLFLIMTCLFLLFNPWYLYNTGFLYSFTISGFLLYFKDLISKKNYFYQLLIISLLSFLSSFPISIYTSFEINILSVLLNLFFVPFVSFVLFPCSFLVLLFSCFSPVYQFLITILETISLWSSENINLLIPFAKPSILIVVFYYSIIIYLLKNRSIKKGYVILIIMIFIHYHIHSFLRYPVITMIDVGQGDSLLLELPYNRGNILIDTGGTYDSMYSLIDSATIPYLKSIGIPKLDYLILTHGDYDHMGEAINLVENFKVEKVIFNCGEFNDLEQELIKVLDKKKIPYYSCIKELNIYDNKLYFLNNKDYDNENDNSSIIYTELDNHKFLFMGDAGKEVEEDLINKYNLSDIDVLKVGHHGSKTSSSSEFINEINPKYSIISVGKNNRYGHPNDSVLENLEDSKIYRTDTYGSIMFKIKNNKLEIETSSP